MCKLRSNTHPALASWTQRRTQLQCLRFVLQTGELAGPSSSSLLRQSRSIRSCHIPPPSSGKFIILDVPFGERTRHVGTQRSPRLFLGARTWPYTGSTRLPASWVPNGGGYGGFLRNQLLRMYVALNGSVLSFSRKRFDYMSKSKLTDWIRIGGTMVRP